MRFWALASAGALFGVGIGTGAGTDARVVFDSTGFANGCYASAGAIDAGRSARDIATAARRGIRLCTMALDAPASNSLYRASILVNRGIVRLRAGRAKAAIADYDAALALSPGLPEALINKGVAYRRIGRPREAVALLTAGIAGGPERPEVAYYQRAIANEEIGAVREAYHDYVEAKTLAPDWDQPAEELKRFAVVRRRTAVG